MSETDHARASISATVNEIAEGHARLGIPVEHEEFCEAWAILQRIEQRILAAREAAE